MSRHVNSGLQAKAPNQTAQIPRWSDRCASDIVGEPWILALHAYESNPRGGALPITVRAKLGDRHGLG